METGYAVESDHRQMGKQSKKKKPGLIKRWFAKMSREVWDDERRNSLLRDDGNDIISSKQARLGIVTGPTGIDQPDRAIQFTVYNANGGRVIETRRYDRHKDRHSNGLYVVTTDQDFGREIDKIITMESLR